MKGYIKCVNVDYESARTEDFLSAYINHSSSGRKTYAILLDIQLNVKGMKTLRDSFRDYIAVETMDGDNKYQAEGYEWQDAKKGIVFQSFPPVVSSMIFNGLSWLR